MFTFLLGFIVSLVVLGTFKTVMSVGGHVLVPLFIGVCIYRGIEWFRKNKTKHQHQHNN